MKKRIVSFLLVLCITVSLCSAMGITAFAYSTGHPNTHTNTGDQRADIVAIAETQVGYAEDPGTKYGAWWGDQMGSSFVNKAWCAMFVLWCADQAGCDAAWSGMSALCSSLLTRYQNGKNGCTAHAFGSGYMPRPGDIIFVGGYSAGTYYTNHVGLVTAVDSTTIYTIEGNYNNKVSRVSYNLETGIRNGSSRRIVYFGVPAYTNDSSAGFNGPVVDTGSGSTDIPNTGINYKTTLLENLNVRADASINAYVMTSLPKGSEVTVVDEKADDTGRMWGRLSTGGWISLRYTTTGSSTTAPVEGETDITDYDAIVACDILLIRTVPGTTGAVDNQVYRGNSVTITATATVNGEEWGKLSTGGWVATKYLTKMDASTETPGTGETTPESPSTPETALFKGTVFASTLNVREQPVSGTIVDILRRDEVVDIYETKDMSGKLWGRTANGWISLSYVHYELPSTPPSTPTTPESGTPTENTACTVTGTAVNVRSGAGTTNPVIGTVRKGDAITIVETAMVGTVKWGKLSTGGWISLSYTNYTTAAQQPATPDGSQTTTPPATTGVTCTVTGTVVNVRSGAGTTNPVSSTVKKGTAVTIVETATVGTTLWGKLSTGGWISLSYTNYSTVSSQQPTTPTVPETPAEPSAPEAELPGNVTELTPENPDSTTTPGTPAGGIAATVSAANLNVRKAAGYTEVVGTVKRGDSVVILETKKVDNQLWGRIASGWVSMDHVTTTSTGSSGLTYTTTAGINIRSGAGTANAVVGSIGKGASVTVVCIAKSSDSKLWCQLSSGGWISMDYLQN